MKTLSVVINTLDEAKNLPRAITSVKNLATEIIVVDMESTDATVEIAKKHGATVFTHKRAGYVEPARNFAISKATGSWVLVLDADEEVSQTLSRIIKKTIEKPKADYYRIPRKNIIFGKWLRHSRWWPDYNIRLFKKGTVSWSEVIHAVPVTLGKGAELPEKEESAIIHYHYDSVEQYVERMNRYTSAHAKLKVLGGYKLVWTDLIKKPVGEFLSRYFFGRGYKDGIHGLALSLLQAASELVMHLKVWQLNKFKDENPTISEVVSLMKEVEKELHFWQSDALLQETGKFIHRVKRKFRI